MSPQDTLKIRVESLYEQLRTQSPKQLSAVCLLCSAHTFFHVQSKCNHKCVRLTHTVVVINEYVATGTVALVDTETDIHTQGVHSTWITGTVDFI